MKKLYSSLLFSLFFLTVNAQTTVHQTQPFGKIDNADLELKACNFEPDANAMVLFDKADVYFDNDFNIVNERHKRIKIFNDNGKKQANIRIPYYTYSRLEYITGLQAQTINLTDGKVEIIKIDKKQVFKEDVDKWNSALVFTFPNVKPGSVIEFKYKWVSTSYGNFPGWFFQEKIPVRYSELVTKVPEFFYYKPKIHITQTLVKREQKTTSESTGAGPDATVFNCEVETMAMANIHSLPDEPYMSSDADNLQSIFFTLMSVKPRYGFVQTGADTWPKIGGRLSDDEDFGKQFKKKLAGEDTLVNKAKALKTDDQKIAFLFNQVKASLKWNGIDRWYTNDGVVKAWEKKTGNSTEINLILYRLLKQAGVYSYPMVVSTREHGKVNQFNALLGQFNPAVVYIRVDSTKYYVLDASDKYNLYNEVPHNLLNSAGLYIDKESDTYDIVFLQNNMPVRQIVYTKADIKPDGKMSGNTQISSYSYNKVKRTSKYKTDGETRFIEYLKNNDNNLKISSAKFENADVDSLPFMQNIHFDLDLAGSDENYIYVNPNILTSLQTNPFLSENRFTDIELSYRDNWSVFDTFTIPAGYKIEALPKSLSITMPDKSITFKRIANQAGETIVIRYTMDHVKTIYFKEEYQDFREFNKQVFEMLNEQIVLKKS